MKEPVKMVQIGLFMFLLFQAVYATQFREGDLRLVGGSYQWEGRVEIYMSGSWGTITDSNWTSHDAQALCRALGYFRPGARAYSGAYFGQGSGPIHLDHIVCSGTEYNLTECETGTGTRQSSHTEDVGVKCNTVDVNYRNGDIRLEGGGNNWEGRVEVFWNGVWGSIISSNWNTAETQVVCRQLGLPTEGAIPRTNAYFGESDGVIIITSVNCISGGTKKRIVQCRTEMLESTDYRTEVGVYCRSGADYKSGDVRLVGGRYSWEGRVEIYLNGEWGTITDDGAEKREARVVCRQLGYDTRSFDVDISYRGAYFGQGLGAIHLDDLVCTGIEYRLVDCGYIPSQKRHNEDWSITCRNDIPNNGEVRLFYSSSNEDYYRGLLLVWLNGTWGTVSDSSWTTKDTETVCRQLGRTAVSDNSYYYNYYNNLPVIMSDVECVGNESRLMDCRYRSGRFFQSYLVSLQCFYNAYSRHGDVRLTGGRSEKEGRIEMRNSRNVWSTICETHWTMENTKVACNALGYSTEEGSYQIINQTLTNSPLPQLDYVRCEGTENSLRECVHFSHNYSQCTHSHDVGIRCSPAPCDNGDVRLVNGSYEWNGFVIVCQNKRWMAPCEDYSSATWMVTCTQLGFTDGYRYYGYFNGYYWQYHISMPKTNLTFYCAGAESRLSDCTIDHPILQSQCNRDMSVRCQLASCADGEVRLVDGETEMEGRVEICFSRRWGTISGDGWTNTESSVVCSDLGYEPSGEEHSVRPATNSQPVFMKNVKCTGRELSLLECGYKRNLTHTSHLTDISVKCNTSECEDGALRLWRGNSEHHGLLQVCFNKRWGSVNADGWTDEDTRVVCRQLKYFSDGKYSTSTFKKVISGPIHMDNVGCHGNEDKLIECSYHTDTSEDRHSEDVWIDCSNTSDSSSEITTTETTTTETTTTEPTTTEMTTTEMTTTEPTTTEMTTTETTTTEITTTETTTTEISTNTTEMTTSDTTVNDLIEGEDEIDASNTDESQSIDVGVILGVFSLVCVLLLAIAFIAYIINSKRGRKNNPSVVKYKKSGDDGSDAATVITNDPEADVYYTTPPAPLSHQVVPPLGPSTGMYTPLTIRTLENETNYATLNEAVPRKKEGGAGGAFAGKRSPPQLPPRRDMKDEK